jgi:hypothetical protein
VRGAEETEKPANMTAVASAPYTLVLTHDVDALRVGDLPLGRTLAGLVYRCLAENLCRLARGWLSWQEYGLSVRAVAEYLPARLGSRLDAWVRSLAAMLEMEEEFGVRSTLFFIPVAREPGASPDNGARAPGTRAAHYRLAGCAPLLKDLVRGGWETGVHGLNAWRSRDDAIRELRAFREACPEQRDVGIRMHWLYRRDGMWEDLDAAGYAYDSTLGWNDRVGFPDDRFWPFRPSGAKRLMVLPLNIQDGALFDRRRTPDDAWDRIAAVLAEAERHRGVVTVLWHTTSFEAPRFWGQTYRRLLCRARADGAAILTAGQSVRRFRRVAQA